MVKKLNNLLVLLTVCMLVLSCSLSRSADESTDYLEQDNLYQKKIKQYTFRLKPFDPMRLIKINYGDSINTFSKQAVDSIISEYKGYLCFVFEIDIDGFKGDIADYETGKPTDFEQRSSYYLFGMQNDFKLKDEKGMENPCLFYYYERLNEIARTNRFIIGFKNTNAPEVTVQYNNPYFNCGNINFSINTHHLAFN